MSNVHLRQEMLEESAAHAGVTADDCVTILARHVSGQVEMLETEEAVQRMRERDLHNCDCPACQPACERTGLKCFITCDRCKNRVEMDDFGPLKSRTFWR